MTTPTASADAAPTEGLDLGTLNLMLEALGEFVAQELPEKRMLELDHEDVCPEDTVRAMCSDALGVQLVFIPEEYGGMGGSAFDSYRVCERMARFDIGLGTSVFATFLGSDPILMGGTDEQRAEWLGRIAEEGIVFAYGATEPEAGSDLGAMTTTAAVPVDDGTGDRGYRITGRKQWISNGCIADAYYDPGHGSRRAVLVHRRDATPRVFRGAARGQARDPAVQHSRTLPRRRHRAGRRTWSAVSRAVDWSRPSRSSATPG